MVTIEQCNISDTPSYSFNYYITFQSQQKHNHFMCHIDLTPQNLCSNICDANTQSSSPCSLPTENPFHPASNHWLALIRTNRTRIFKQIRINHNSPKWRNLCLNNDSFFCLNILRFSLALTARAVCTPERG